MYRLPRIATRASKLVPHATLFLSVRTGAPVSNRLLRRAALARQVDALLGRVGISYVVACSGQMAQYLPARFGGPVLMDFVDVDSAKFRTYPEQDSRQPITWVHNREARMPAA